MGSQISGTDLPSKLFDAKWGAGIIFNTVEFPCHTLLTHAWASKTYIRRSYEALHICVGKAEHCLMEWWEKLLSSSHSVCMHGLPSSTNSMGRRGWSSQIHGKPSPIHWALWMGELKTSHPSVHAWLSSPAQDSLWSFALVPDCLQVQCWWRCARSMQSNCMAWFM